MAEAINPKLWRNQSQIPFSQVQEATDEQKALYQFLGRKVKGSLEECELAKYPMPPEWREFVKNQEALIRSES